MPNPTKITDPRTFQKRTDDFFDQIEKWNNSHTPAEAKVPLYENLLTHLRMTDRAYQRCAHPDIKEAKSIAEQEENEDKRKIAEVCAKTQLRLSAALIESGAKDPRLTSLAIFLLKQPHNGGYIDKPAQENSAPQKVVVEIKGMEGKDAFG